MTLHIRHPEADQLARRLAKATGKPLTQVVIEALREQLRRAESRAVFPRLKDEIMAISRRTAGLRRRTGRSAMTAGQLAAARHGFRNFGVSQLR